MIEKIDIYNTEGNYKTQVKSFKKDANNGNRELILDYLRDCELGKTIKNRAKKKIGVGRRSKILSSLSRISNWIKKPFVNLTQEELENFILDLERDKYKKKDRNNFSDSTKVDFKKILRKFILWMNKNKETSLDVSFIDTYQEEKEVPALTREEVEKLISRTNNLKTRFIIKVLFDGGLRIEEFLNLRGDDLTWKQDLSCYMIRVRISKTKPRTISLQLSTKEIDNHIEELKENKQFKSENPLISMTYDAVRVMLKRLGKKVLNKRVTPHLLRHTSATYYANKLSYFQLCYRYGWTMSSKQPNRYIDREGIKEQETAKIIRNDELGNVQEKNKKLEEDIIRLKEQISGMPEMFEKLNQTDNIIKERVKQEIKDLIKEGLISNEILARQGF